MIYTVTGAVNKNNFKKACVHEHVCIVSNDMLNAFGKEWFDKKKFIPLAVEVLKKSGLYNQIGAENIFENDDDNPTLSAAKAIRTAQKYITKGGVSIYASAPIEK